MVRTSRLFPAARSRSAGNHEPEISYGFTDFLKLELALKLEQPFDETLEATAFGIASYLELARDPSWGGVFSVFTKVSFGVEEGVTNSAQFGPLARFGDDEFGLVLNAIFDKTFGEFRETGTSFKYAAQLKLAVADAVSLGGELFGEIPNIEDVSTFNETEFRLGPVLYLSSPSIGPAEGAQPLQPITSGFDFTADIGILLGTTGATPEWTIKWDLELTF